MGNCTSKKSAKTLKLNSGKKTIFQSKMEREQEIHSKGLSSKKVAPFTRGEMTSFGFKKRSPPSQLPVAVTLTASGHPFRDLDSDRLDRLGQTPGRTSQKNLSDGYHSGSSVESLCHAPIRSTPKMVRKRDLVSSQVPCPKDKEYSVTVGVKANKISSGSSSSQGLGSDGDPEPVPNRFGFRQQTPPRASEPSPRATTPKSSLSPINRISFLTGQGSCDTASLTPNAKSKSELASRSRSEGPKEAFFKQTLHSSNSIQWGLNQSKSSADAALQPRKFTLQTSHLPRPQFPVRMTDPKTAKTATNYYRRGGVRNEAITSKEGSPNDDSGFESHSSANNTLEKKIEIYNSSPGCKVRRRLPACKGKKLEMKVVGNKFELLKQEDDTRPDVVTEISVIKLPVTNTRTTTAVINTGLVEQRTNQYLKRISQTYRNNNKNDLEESFREPARLTLKAKTENRCPYGNVDEGREAESEEEKLFKDSKKSEKYLMSEGCDESDDMLPGEAMAEDEGFGLSFEEDSSVATSVVKVVRPTFLVDTDVTPNSIRLDALKLSKQLKRKNSPTCNGDSGFRKDVKPTFELLNVYEKDEDTFPSDSILEHLSSDSDSLGDKGENKNNDKEKNFRMRKLELKENDSEIDLGGDDNESLKSDTDIDENDLDLIETGENAKDAENNCLGSYHPASPDTPTPTSNSMSISDGRDFLIDDEIADQPQLCFSEKYVDVGCRDEDEDKGEGEEGRGQQVRQDKPAMAANQFQVLTENKATPGTPSQILTVNIQDEGVKGLEGNLIVKEDTEEKGGRLNTEGTLSPCESITSDDLMLDFESNSFDENAGRLDIQNANIFPESENAVHSINNNDLIVGNVSSQNYDLGTKPGISVKAGEDNKDRTSNTGQDRSKEVVSSPLRRMKASAVDDDSVKLDKVSYQHVFQDVISMKSMLLKLKRLLSESEGNVHQEFNALPPSDCVSNNIVEDELTDLRRQVLFLQQQLEEREKTVQVLKLKIDKAPDSMLNTPAATESRQQCNAATQTGLDQFQQDFPHFRIFQTTPVV